MRVSVLNEYFLFYWEEIHGFSLLNDVFHFKARTRTNTEDFKQTIISVGRCRRCDGGRMVTIWKDFELLDNEVAFKHCEVVLECFEE
jgi:hypothetical protein